MSGEQPKAPRPIRSMESRSSHVQAKQPFPQADDIDDIPPEEVHELTEPTMASVHRGMVLGFLGVHKRMDGYDRRLGLFHEELALLRADHGPRITAAEREVRSVDDKVEAVTKTLPQKAVAGASKAGQLVTLAVGALGLLAQAANLIDPKIAGPIQIVLQLLQSMGVQ